MIKTRKIADLTVSSIGLGCMGMSEFYGTTDRAESIKLLQYAYDQGINLFDTADIYGMGANEILIGEALKDLRSKVIIATKCGIVRKLDDPNYRSINGKPAYIKKCLDESLKRLKTDYVDLFYLHRVDINVPIEDSVGAMSQLVSEGKVRHIGLSEASTATIRKANAIHPIAAIQTEYSMGSREVEGNGVLQLTKELDISFIAYSPLSRGLLTNTLSYENNHKDFRNLLPRFNEENKQKNLAAIAAIKEFAADHGMTTAQLALVWLLAKDQHIIPIPGTKKQKYLAENIQAMQINLNATELAKLNLLVNDIKFQGARYPEAVIKDYNLNG